jgi:hypothetical protein
VNSFFNELGRSVAALWKQQNFSFAGFPEIAQRVLEENPPASSVDVSALIQEFLLSDDQPFQTESGFGQPELVVYDEPRFYIQILFWLEGTTDIHQHEFSGAFHVLQGSSLHSRYEFADPEPITAHLRVGRLRLQSARLLETGRTEIIRSGGGYIHSLFHLDTPSLTVVVRTHTDPGTGPQFTYLPPHLAVDPFQHDALTARRKQLLDVLEATNDADYAGLVVRMIETLDFERGFFILQNGLAHLKSAGGWEAVWHAFEQRHGRLAELARPTLEEIAWRGRIAAYRSSITEVELRFFLALLLNLPSRAEIFRLVAQRFPGSPAETILRWCEELCHTSDFSTWMLDAEFPAAIAAPLEEQPAILLAALRSFIERENDPASRDGLTMAEPDLEALRAAFVNSSLRAFVRSES